MATVFLNGNFLDQADARVSAFDAGFQHGVGLFETMLGGTTPLDETWVYRLDEHLERLAASARELGLSESLRTQGLYDAVMETAARSGHQRARIRLTITAGDLNLLAAKDPDAEQEGGHVEATVLIVAQPATTYPDAMFERGVLVTLADTRANPLNRFEGHKTLNYWWRLQELQAASAKGAAEAIVLQVSNHLVGGCVSNIFVVKDGSLLTPIARGEEGGGTGHAAEAHRPEAGATGGGALPSPVLPGITRRAIIELAEMRTFPIERRMLSIDDLLGADEVFLTNSSWGVLPVVAVEAHQVGPGTPGEITRELRGAWVRAVTGEID
jgi:branched-chain amino acid aminotransferase